MDEIQMATAIIRLTASLSDHSRRLEKLESKEFPIGDLPGPFFGLPWLRGFWPMNSLDEIVAVRDLGGQGRTLTINGGVGSGIHNSLIAYLTFNGTTGYLSRASEAALNITGVLTMGGWFWCNAFAGTQVLISKDVAGSRGYNLYFNATGGLVTEAWTSNVANSTVTSAALASAAAWHFCVMRFTPSTEIAVCLDGTFTKNTTAIVASIQASTAQFQIGALGGPGSFLAGRAAPVFICREALPDTLIGYLFARTRPFFQVSPA